jgi:hypothetical protein
MLWNVASEKCRYRNTRDNGIKKSLQEINIERLTADCVRRRIKMIKTVYSQEINIYMKSKKSGAGTNNLYKPKLVWLDILR